jgi:carbamate kinase
MSINMGAKFVSEALFSKETLKKAEHIGKTFKFDTEVGYWVVTPEPYPLKLN